MAKIQCERSAIDLKMSDKSMLTSCITYLDAARQRRLQVTSQDAQDVFCIDIAWTPFSASRLGIESSYLESSFWDAAPSSVKKSNRFADKTRRLTMEIKGPHEHVGDVIVSSAFRSEMEAFSRFTSATPTPCNGRCCCWAGGGKSAAGGRTISQTETSEKGEVV